MALFMGITISSIACIAVLTLSIKHTVTEKDMEGY